MSIAIEGTPAGPSARQDAVAIDIRGMGKRFGGTQALDGVNLTIETGRIHSLVGANGAGKSTLLGILAGRLQASEGVLRIFGQPKHFAGPRNAKQAGICAIYQELTIVPALSARANVFLGQELSRHGLLLESEMESIFNDLARRLRVTIDSDAAARSLSVADQQTLEIMRGLQSQARILLFDEPTTALAPAERSALFRSMRDLREAGTTMVLVSHNLDEVLDVSDAITVFRDGKVVADAPRANWTKNELVKAMIGRDLASPAAASAGAPGSRTKPVLSVRNLRLPGVLEAIDLEIRPGEILGVGGLVGSGRTSLLRAIAGLESASTGEMSIDGENVVWPRSPRMAIRHGIGLVPEDRKYQGLVPNMSALDNLALADLSRAARGGIIQDDRLREFAHPLAKAFGFNPARLSSQVRTLSGGNQQKVLLARWGYKVPRILLIDEPTRGIDIGAKDDILKTIRTLASGGLGVIVVSSELEEVVAISDRVIVISMGQIAARLDAGASLNVDSILKAAFGVKHEI